MMNRATAGSLGLATPSRWMNSELFVEIMLHFIKCSNSTKENASLLILKNYEVQISTQITDQRIWGLLY